MWREESKRLPILKWNINHANSVFYSELNHCSRKNFGSFNIRCLNYHPVWVWNKRHCFEMRGLSVNTGGRPPVNNDFRCPNCCGGSWTISNWTCLLVKTHKSHQECTAGIIKSSLACYKSNSLLQQQSFAFPLLAECVKGMFYIFFYLALRKWRNVFLKKTNCTKRVQSNKQLFVFPLHCKLKPCAALKGVPPPNGPRGDEGVNWCRCWWLLHTRQGAPPQRLLLEAVLMKC